MMGYNVGFDSEIRLENEKLKKWIIKNYGKRCGDYVKGCACCGAWKLFDRLKI